MIKKYKDILNLLVSFFCILLLPFSLHASMDLVYDLQTAKVSGLGGSNISGVYGAESIFYNWALPGDYIEWKFEQATILEDSYFLTSIQNPFNISTLRFGALYQSISDINETQLNSFNQPILTGENISHYMFAIFSSTSKKIFNSHIGFRHTLFYESINSETALSNQLDLSIHHRFSLFSHPVYYGGSVKNIFKSSVNWSTKTSDQSPRIFTTGLSTSFFEKRLTLSTDHIFSFQDGYDQTNFGIEYFVFGDSKSKPYMAVRGGICEKEFSLGTSINLDGWIFDYSYTHDTPFNNISSTELLNQHRFSIGKSFKDFYSIRQRIEFNRSNINKVKQNQYDSFLKVKIPQQENIIPKQFVNLSIDINLNTNTSTVTQQLKDNQIISRLNFQSIDKSLPIEMDLPLKWIAYLKNEKNIFMLDIEKTKSGKLHLSGYIPDYFSTYINGELIEKVNADNSFYKKITPDMNNFSIEIILESKP